MNPDVIQFACGHCQSWLTVPAHMAGVAGPCPKCGGHIVSPQAQPPQPVYEPAPAAAPPMAPGNWQPAEQPAMPQGYPGAPPPQWPGAGLTQPQDPYPQGGQLPPRQMQPAPAYNELYPPAPAAAPMVPPPGGPPPWGLPPTVTQAIPDSGLPGGYPLHTQGLRPNAGLPQARGAGLPPPVGQVQPQAGMPGQMPGGPMAYDPTGQTGMLTRPASVGGSRLSLLARQLTTPPEGAPGLPMAPAPLSTSELPGQAPAAYGAPSASKNQQAGDMMLKQNMRRGLVVGRSSGGGKTKFALAALLLLSLIGALGWQYRGPIRDIVAEVFPPKPALPETSEPPPSGAVPGVDKMAPNSGSTLTSRTVAVPPDAAPKPTAPPPEGQSTVARAVPIPAPGEVKDVKTMPLSSPEEVAKNSALVSPKPTKENLDLMATINAPRAQAVDEADEIKPLTTPAKPAGPVNPLLDGPQKLVEVPVGINSTDVKAAQAAAPAPASALGGGQPVIKNVPPACKGAVEGLLNFLNARNWQERSKYIQLASQMEPKLKLYYASNPDGPIDVDEVQYLRHDDSPQVGKGQHAVFVLFSRNWEYGFPVMVEVTADGARVDWLTFIEFKDNMLNKFMSNYMEERVQFHVGIRRTHYFDENIPALDKKEAFTVTSPMENIRGWVFVPKGTSFARSLSSTISWDKEASWVVVELQWRKEGTAKWVEMTALPQLNWYSAGASEQAARQAMPPVPAPPGSVAR